jgi:hypothetical protein
MGFHAAAQFVKRGIDQYVLLRAAVTVQKSHMRLRSHRLATSTILYSACTVHRAELKETSTVFWVVTPCRERPKFRRNISPQSSGLNIDPSKVKT